jgi:hypothetical protein
MEGGVAITIDGLVFLCSLQVVFLIFGKDLLMLMGQVILQGVVLLIWRFGLLLENLVFNSG